MKILELSMLFRNTKSFLVPSKVTLNKNSGNDNVTTNNGVGDNGSDFYHIVFIIFLGYMTIKFYRFCLIRLGSNSWHYHSNQFSATTSTSFQRTFSVWKYNNLLQFVLNICQNERLRWHELFSDNILNFNTCIFITNT